MSGQHVADAGDPAVWAAEHGEPLQCERGPGAIPQQVFETPKIARHVAVDYDWIECNGFEVAGPEAWPMPTRLNPGMNIRPPLVWELDLLTGCLRDVVGFVAAVPPGPRGSTGSRTATEWTSPAGWRLAWEC